MHTVTGTEAATKLNETLQEPPEGVNVLFGAAPTRRDNDSAHRGRRGALAVDDCHSVGQITAEEWTNVVTLRPDDVRDNGKAERREVRGERNLKRDEARAALQVSLRAIDRDLPLTVSDHVAIDRWTGGAGDHRLFSALDPAPTLTWEPIRLRVDLPHLGKDDMALPLLLLLLLLRDLRDGWLSLGYGGTRGRGGITVTDITFTGTGLPDGWQSLAGQTLDQILATPPPQVTDAMTHWADTHQPAESGVTA
jgi:hypothetical protein